ncbi:lipopolysaccharide biosynthesis protein [Thiobacillus denitrificans]|uniref:lipopolysaccharide biosynthesis protein n=1 Tax=Thiobacillus denitrificans TaxID=36861 RepID=UPI00004631CF|nr:hypothetical protein [Thiobacillus denitrificans]
MIGIAWLFMLVRELPLADYGAYVTFTAFLNIFVVVGSFGLIAVAERYVPEHRSLSSGPVLARFLTRLIALRVVLLAVACLAMAGFSAHLPALLSIEGMADTFLVFQIVVFGEGLCRYIETIFDSLLQQKYSQISTLFRYGTRLLALLAYPLLSDEALDLFTWITIEAVTVSLGALLALALMSKIVRQARHEEGERAGEGKLDYPRYIRYAAPIYLGRILALFSGIEMAKLVTTKMLGLEASAVFGFCASLAITLQRYLPTYLLMGMVRPLFITAFHSERPQKRLDFLFSLIVKLNMFAILPALAVTTVLGDGVVHLFSSGKISEGGLMLTLMLGFVVSQALRIAHGMVLISLEDGKGSLLIAVAGATVFALSALFVSVYGPVALVLGLVAADFVAMAIAGHRIRMKSYRLNYPYRGIGKLFIATVGATLFISLLDLSLAGYGEISRVLAAAGLGMVLYALLAQSIRPFTDEERGAINRMLPVRLFVW